MIYAAHTVIGRLCGVQGRHGKNGLHLATGSSYRLSTLKALARHLPSGTVEEAERWLKARRVAYSQSRLSPAAQMAYRAKVRDHRNALKEYIRSEGI